MRQIDGRFSLRRGGWTKEDRVLMAAMSDEALRDRLEGDGGFYGKNFALKPDHVTYIMGQAGLSFEQAIAQLHAQDARVSGGLSGGK